MNCHFSGYCDKMAKESNLREEERRRQRGGEERGRRQRHRPMFAGLDLYLLVQKSY